MSASLRCLGQRLAQQAAMPSRAALRTPLRPLGSRFMAPRSAAFQQTFQQQPRSFTTRVYHKDSDPSEILNVLPVQERTSGAMVDNIWSGCMALPCDADGHVPEEVGRQIELAFQNAGEYLSHNKSSLDSTFRVDIVYKDEADLPTIMDAYQRVFPTGKPFKQFIPARPNDFDGGDWKVAVNVIANKKFAWVLPSAVFLAINWAIWGALLA